MFKTLDFGRPFSKSAKVFIDVNSVHGKPRTIFIFGNIKTIRQIILRNKLNF